MNRRRLPNAEPLALEHLDLAEVLDFRPDLGIIRLHEQRVVILLRDGLEFIAAFIGAMRIGAIPVPLNTWATPGELAFMIGDCRAQALIVDAEFLDSISVAPPAIRNFSTSVHQAISAAVSGSSSFFFAMAVPSYAKSHFNAPLERQASGIKRRGC